MGGVGGNDNDDDVGNDGDDDDDYDGDKNDNDDNDADVALYRRRSGRTALGLRSPTRVCGAVLWCWPRCLAPTRRRENC